ncbi:MAG: PaaI family thioesterase [Sphingomonadales bacterium]|nr:PaaI family thioesterase [Sphingomonadales bacterium]
MNAAVEAPTGFLNVESPDHPGWMTWDLSDNTRFNAVLGAMLVRRDGDVARVRIFPAHGHTNMNDNVHGGVSLAFADIALFAGARMLGMATADNAVTLDLSMQFLGAGVAGIPLDAEVELLRETGRLAFLRGILSQEQGLIAAFSGTLRKATVR